MSGKNLSRCFSLLCDPPDEILHQKVERRNKASRSKDNRQRLIMLIFLPVVVMVFSCTGLAEQRTSCDHHVNRTWMGNSTCLHSLASNCDVIVNCRLKKMADLGQLISSPRMVKYLNLSNNGIRHIQRTAFDGLVNLNVLDLSFNSLITWNTLDITSQLPSLTELNVIGNPSWLPGQHIRDLPNITVIKGIASYTMPYLDHCVHCNLQKNPDDEHTTDVLSITYKCTKVTFSFHRNFTDVWSLNFTTKCHVLEFDNNICKQTRRLSDKATYYSVDNEAICIQELNQYAIPNIMLGMLALTSNFVVIATVVLSPELRKNVGLFLLSNMAIGDFLQGLWLFILSVTRRFTTSSEFYKLQMPFFCISLYVMLLASQYITVVLTLLVTVERYLCIVYSMKPKLHMTLKTAVVLITGVYLLSAVAVPLPLAIKLPRDEYFCANVGSSFGALFIDPRLSVAILLYLICYVLYAHIFITVKKSNSNLGIQREGKLAKRILMVIITNFMFGLIPRIVGQLSFKYRYTPVSLESNGEWLTSSLVFYLFVINPCLNPVLFAFRNHKFKNRLKRVFKFRENVVDNVGVYKGERNAGQIMKKEVQKIQVGGTLKNETDKQVEASKVK